MNRPIHLFTALALVVIAAGCGRALSTPEALAIRDYPANQKITLTFLMKSCSDTCETYEAASCSFALDKTTLRGSIAVPYGTKAGADPDRLTNCSLSCGPQVLAHCEVGPLESGTYAVEVGSFKSSITIH